jgi:uncharacterized membrane protein
LITSRRERGAVIPLLALMVSLIVLVGAFTIDLGQAMLLRRDLQRVADVTALDASHFVVDGSAASQLAVVRAAAVRSAARNDWTLDASDVHLVERSGTSWTRIDSSLSQPDGVEVVAHGSVKYSFQPGSGDTSRSAVAARQSAAGLEIGSSLVSIDTTQATMLNRVFGIFGGNTALNLSLGSWQGLGSANVALGGLVTAAGSSDADAYLRTSATLGTQLQILATALSAEGNTGAATQVDNLRSAFSAGVTATTVRFGDLVTVTGADADSFAGAQLNALALTQGELFLARKGTAVSGTFASGVAGIAAVSLSAKVVQPPTIAFGPVGTSATNGQIEVTIGTNLGGLVPVQLSVGAATGTATLTSAACSGLGPASAATAEAHTSLSGVALTVLGLPVALGVTAVPPTTLTFSAPFTWSHSQHVGGTSLGLVAAIGGAVSGLGPIVTAVVNPLIAPLENAVVSPILRALGVSLAGADVAVLDPRCLPPLLVR